MKHFFFITIDLKYALLDPSKFFLAVILIFLSVSIFIFLPVNKCPPFLFFFSHSPLLLSPYYCTYLRNFLSRERYRPIYYTSMTRILICWLVWYKVSLPSNSAHPYIPSWLTGIKSFSLTFSLFIFHLFFLFYFAPNLKIILK